jgi:signal transduction histidine kinase
MGGRIPADNHVGPPSGRESVMSGVPLHIVDTSYASPARADGPMLGEQRRAFLSDPVAVELLDAMPGPAMVLNRHRQIVAVNGLMREAFGLSDSEGLLGLRPGELLQCVHANERAAGCGTTRACAHCGAVNAVLECLATRRRTTREARLTTRAAHDGGALDVRVHASSVEVGGVMFVVVGLEDIGDRKRRQVLERVLLADLLASWGRVGDVAGRLEQPAPGSGDVRTAAGELRRVADESLERLESHRQLLAAERGELAVEPRDVNVVALLEDLARRHRELPVAQGRTIRLEHGRACELRTDPALLARALGDLLVNALEASPAGGTVSVTCELEGRIATFSVHNDGVIPDDVQLQVFQRSFTTTGVEGRGVGTYGVKLIVERYLGGDVEFVSDDRVGTLFVVVVPDARELRRDG